MATAPPVRLRFFVPDRFEALIESSFNLPAILMLQASTIIEAGQEVRVAVSQAAGLRLSTTANAPREIDALIPGNHGGSNARGFLKVQGAMFCSYSTVCEGHGIIAE